MCIIIIGGAKDIFFKLLTFAGKLLFVFWVLV